MYTLDILKNNNIDYSWSTIYVGRKLGFLKPEEISKYAIEYLMANPHCTDSSIAELACGVPKNEIEELTKALNNIGLNIEKDGPIWNLEKRKWRYCILKNLASKYSNDPEKFLRAYDLVWADFGHPQDMENHLSFYVKDDTENEFDNIDDYFQHRMDRIFKTIVSEEEIKIKEQDMSWPESYNYPPKNE